MHCEHLASVHLVTGSKGGIAKRSIYAPFVRPMILLPPSILRKPKASSSNALAPTPACNTSTPDTTTQNSLCSSNQTGSIQRWLVSGPISMLTALTIRSIKWIPTEIISLKQSVTSSVVPAQGTKEMKHTLDRHRTLST